MQQSAGAREVARRTLNKDSSEEKEYVIAPMLEEQKNNPNVVELMLKTHQRGVKMAGSLLLYADIAAPDLFSWLQNTLIGMQGIEAPVIAENEKYWKLSYKISKIEEPEDNEDDELRELLFDNVQF